MVQVSIRIINLGFIQDVPSLGRVTRFKGIKIGRQHELLSDMEKQLQAKPI